MSQTLHAEPAITYRKLSDRDRSEASSLLERDLFTNLQLLERVDRYGISGAGATIGVALGRELVGVATASPTLHAGVAPTLDEHELAAVGDVMSETIGGLAIPIKAIVAGASTVAAIWRGLESRLPSPTVDRVHQPIYVLDVRDLATPEGSDVRLATADELDQIVEACAAMYREELEIDPITRDESWFRSRILDLIRSERSWVWTIDGRIAFKCEIAASAGGVAQIMGVWTEPSLRRRGLATEGLRQICSRLAARHEYVSLFVNDYNETARRLYDRLGFVERGAMRAMIW